MTFPGPWIDPGERWVPVSTYGGQVDQGDPGFSGNPDSGADTTTVTSTTAVPPATLVAAAMVDTAPSWWYDQGTLNVAFRTSDLLYVAPTPPNAIGWEIEPPALGVYLGPTTVDLAVASIGTDPTADSTWDVYDLAGWHPGNILAGLTRRQAFTFANTADVSIPVETAAYAETTIGGDTQRTCSLLIVSDRQVTHVALAAGDTSERVAVTAAVVSVWAHPPRYRYLYERPLRLRQFPRDDYLGGAPRHGKASTSVQASARVGWTGTYR